LTNRGEERTYRLPPSPSVPLPSRSPVLPQRDPRVLIFPSVFLKLPRRPGSTSAIHSALTYLHPPSRPLQLARNLPPTPPFLTSKTALFPLSPSPVFNELQNLLRPTVSEASDPSVSVILGVHAGGVRFFLSVFILTHALVLSCALLLHFLQPSSVKPSSCHTPPSLFSNGNPRRLLFLRRSRLHLSLAFLRWILPVKGRNFDGSCGIVVGLA